MWIVQSKAVGAGTTYSLESHAKICSGLNCNTPDLGLLLSHIILVVQRAVAKS